MAAGRLLILGASGHGKVAGDCADAAGNWRELAFFDDRWPELQSCGPWPVIGTGEDLAGNLDADDEVFVAIGNGESRIKWLQRFREDGIRIATIVHPRAVVSSRAAIGAGTLVVAGAVVNIDTRLGIGVIVNTGATIDHDCLIGDGVHVCPGAHLAGDVTVGEGSWIGIGSAVRQGIRIGSGVTVGAGSAVIADIADGLTVAGVPAKPLQE
ncbi:MAG: acetyltransferase [Hyphomicrobiales bacterium]|nr:acetyltransferase [Hyphomicrobiales bacterium]